MVSSKSLDLNLVNKLMGYKLAKEKMRAGAQDYKHAYHVCGRASSSLGPSAASSKGTEP